MLTFKNPLRSLRQLRFLRREDGSVTIEAMIILPVMFWTFLSLFSIFESFRYHGINQKAAFTISDAISRETLPIDRQYLNGMLDTFEYLARSQGASTLRVSSIWYDADNDRFWSDWSQTAGGGGGNVTPLTNADVQNWHDKLPVIPNLERVMVVETWSTFDPPFDTGLEQRDIRNFVFTRPRYAPRVCWDQCN